MGNFYQQLEDTENVEERNEHLDKSIVNSFMEELREARKQFGSYSVYWSYLDYQRGIFPTRLASWTRQPYLSEEKQSKIDIKLYRSVIAIVNGRIKVNPEIVEACEAEGLCIYPQDAYTIKIAPEWKMTYYPRSLRDCLFSISESILYGCYTNTLAQNKLVMEATGVLRKFKSKIAFLNLNKESCNKGNVNYTIVWKSESQTMNSTISLNDYREIMNELRVDNGRGISKIIRFAKM